MRLVLRAQRAVECGSLLPLFSAKLASPGAFSLYVQEFKGEGKKCRYASFGAGSKLPAQQQR